MQKIEQKCTKKYFMWWLTLISLWEWVYGPNIAQIWSLVPSGPSWRIHSSQFYRWFGKVMAWNWVMIFLRKENKNYSVCWIESRRQRYYAVLSSHCRFHLFKDFPLPTLGQPLGELSNILSLRFLKVQAISSGFSSILQWIQRSYYEITLIFPCKMETCQHSLFVGSFCYEIVFYCVGQHRQGQYKVYIQYIIPNNFHSVPDIWLCSGTLNKDLIPLVLQGQ